MFIKNIKHKIKELFIIKDGYHEIYHDFEKEIFMQKVLSWITKTINFGKTDKR
jgi:esterase/lipase